MLMDGCTGVRRVARRGREQGAIMYSGLLASLFLTTVSCQKPDGPDLNENKFTLGRETLEYVSSV